MSHKSLASSPALKGGASARQNLVIGSFDNTRLVTTLKEALKIATSANEAVWVRLSSGKRGSYKVWPGGRCEFWPKLRRGQTWSPDVKYTMVTL